MNRELGGNSGDGWRWTEVSDGMGLVMGHGTANGKLEEGEGVDVGGRGGMVGEVGKIMRVERRTLGWWRE